MVLRQDLAKHDFGARFHAVVAANRSIHFVPGDNEVSAVRFDCGNQGLQRCAAQAPCCGPGLGVESEFLEVDFILPIRVVRPGQADTIFIGCQVGPYRCACRCRYPDCIGVDRSMQVVAWRCMQIDFAIAVLFVKPGERESGLCTEYPDTWMGIRRLQLIAHS